MRSYSITESENRRINAESVIKLGELMLTDGTVQPGTQQYRYVRRMVKEARRQLQTPHGMGLDYGRE